MLSSGLIIYWNIIILILTYNLLEHYYFNIGLSHAWAFDLYGILM